MDRRRHLLLERRRLLLKLLAVRKIKIRSCSVREIFKVREEEGAYYTLIPRMREHDISSYVNFLRVTPNQLDFIVNKVAASLTKPDTNFRKAVTPGEKVCLTLRIKLFFNLYQTNPHIENVLSIPAELAEQYLASGDSMRSLSYLFLLGYSTVSEIISETCDALWNNLQEYLKAPSNQEEWRAIAADFEKRWQFPNCLGAIDGKHVNIQAPPNSGALYYNYKNFYSMVLMAIADAKYSFIIVNVGDYGHNSDSSVFSNTDFGKALAENKISLPQSRNIENFNLPDAFVADEAFPLKPYLMRPYSARDLDTKKRIFNYRLSRARRVVEYAFGILTARFRVLRRPILAKIETIEGIIKGCIVLHNFILKTSNSWHCVKKSNTRQNTDDEQGLLPLPYGTFRNYSHNAANVRDNFAEYFSSEKGKVSWQYEKIISGWK